MSRLKHFNRYTDEELLEIYRQDRQRQVLGVLFERHTHKLYGLCLNYLKDPDEAEDSVMDIFEALPAKILAYDIAQFEPWLFIVTRNHCLKKFKRLVKRRTEDLKEIGEDFFMENPLEEDHDIEGQRLELLSDAINSLREGQRDCIVLFFLKGKTYKEIVAMTDYEENEVKTHIQNGKRNLKNWILNKTQ
jgi:RNA polymerase sigma-70 factor (ECF subfamily)